MAINKICLYNTENKKLEERNKQMELYSKKRTSSIKSVSEYQNPSSSETAGKSVEVNQNIKPGSIAGYAHMLSGKKDNSEK